MPPHEGLEADDFAGRQADDRLIVQFKLSLVDRATDVGCKFASETIGRAHAVVEDANAIAAVRFGLIEGEIDVFHRVFD